MNLEEIYLEFTAAKAKYDVEKMCNIIFQLKEHYSEFLNADNKEEIPEIARHIMDNYPELLIYCAMKFLNSGKGMQAMVYLLAVSKIAKTSFIHFPHLRYLLGRALYLTGDYKTALDFFNRYEEARYNQLRDFDELNLFYQANCLALLGDFKSAAKLYESILTVKAAFPEVKKNLDIVRRGSNKNLVRELKSLWKFCTWRDVPIFINARDRLGVMKKLIDWLLAAGYRNLIILDNASTYPPLLEYYNEIERMRGGHIKIVRFEKNIGYKSLWQSGILEQMKISTPYVYTDPDILPIERCPKNFVKRLMEILDSNHEIRKVGLGLVFEDITFFDKEKTKEREEQFYKYAPLSENLHYAQVDTTFALYSNVRHYNLRFSLRTTGNLQAYHLPWYFDYDNLPEDEKYYMAHADKNSITSVKKFWEE